MFSAAPITMSVIPAASVDAMSAQLAAGEMNTKPRRKPASLEAVLEDGFPDLDGIECGTFPEVIRNHPEV